MTAPTSIDAYISRFPQETQALLREMREVIRAAAPTASEKISYAIPTFHLNGNLVHFAGYGSHIGFYPGASGIRQFKDELRPYKSAKGSVQFPLGAPLPVDLIAECQHVLAVHRDQRSRGSPPAGPARPGG